MSQHDLLDTLRSLALPDDCPELHGQDLPISKHAIRRYQERVESVGRRRAEERLRQLVLDAHWYPLPRPWTQIVIHRGSHYGYTPIDPDVCVIERGGVVRTVISRRFLAAVSR